jgi:hypothetical protein
MKRSSWIAVVLMLAAALLAGEARAHGGKSHRLMGTVASVEAERLVIEDTAGKEVAVRLTAETRFEREGKPVDRSAVAAGTRVSIQLTEDDTTAVLVKVGAAPGSR